MKALKSEMSEQLPSFLKKAREDAQITQKELAEHLGYSTSQFISNWENGRSSPPLNVLSQISKKLEIDPEALVDIILQDTKRLLEKQICPKAAQAK